MSISVATSSRFFGRLREAQGMVEQLVCAATGFIMSGASIMLSAAPFGVAWAGAVAPNQALSATLGAAFGYLILLKGSGSLRYIACLGLLLALRWALSFIPKSKVVFYSPLFAAASVATTGLAIALMDKASPYGFIMAFCETAITATAGILFGKAQRAIKESSCLAKTNAVCTGIFSAALYMGLCALDIGKISTAEIFAFSMILCCGFFAGTGVSCAVSIAAGLASALAGEPHALAMFCSGGLAAGVFAPLGRLGSCCSFTISVLLAYAAQSGFEGITFVLTECVLACAIAAVIPASALRHIGLARATDSAQGEMLRRVVTEHLSRIKHALCDIATVTGEVSAKLAEIGADPIESVLARSCSQVCRGCKSSPRCWQTGYNTTADALNHAFSAAREGKQATSNDLPAHFCCERKDKLIAAINEQTDRYTEHRIKKRQLAQLRCVSGDQFSGMSELLSSLEQKLSEYSCAGTQTAEAVSKYIKSKDCEAYSVCCYLDEEKHISILVELPVHKAARLLSPEVTADLSELVLQELCRPEHVFEGSKSRVFWTARSQYAIESAFLQRAANFNRFCGDSCKVIDQTNSRAVMLLCDGMGIGTPAAVDATMTSSLLERLLKAGADFNASLHLVNAALLSGGGEERLCTVDAAILDLYTCRLDLFKAGAAPTYILRKKRCATVEAQSLPAGILGGTQAKHTTLNLSEGDIIVMVSDGLLETGGDWIPSELVSSAELSLEEMCERLINTAHSRRISEREDDMTVVAAKIAAA